MTKSATEFHCEAETICSTDAWDMRAVDVVQNSSDMTAIHISEHGTPIPSTDYHAIAMVGCTILS